MLSRISERIVPLLVIRHKFSFLVALALYFATTFGDSIAFKPAGNYWQDPMYYLVKVIVLTLFVGLSQFVPYAYLRFKSGDQVFRRFIKYSLVYALLLFVVWILVYPGAYTGFDEPYLTEAARTLNASSTWHHILTVIWYAVAFGIFPSLSSVTLLQLLLVSLIVGYIMSQVHNLVGAKRSLLIFSIFLLPSVFLISLLPHRLSIYGFLELLLFFTLFKTYIQQEKFSIMNAIVLGVLTALVAVFRSEAMIFIVLIPSVVGILFVRHRMMSRRVFGVYTGVAVSFFCTMFAFQNVDSPDRVSYQATALIEPVSSVVVGGDYVYSDYEKSREVIDKVLDYDRLVAGENASVVYWSRPGNDISSKELSDFGALATELVAQNPKKFVKGSLKNYTKANSMWPELPVVLQPNLNNPQAKGLIVSEPWSTGIRNQIINILRAVSFDRTHYTPLVRVIYNSFPITVLLMAMMVYMLIKREILVLLPIVLLAKNVIVLFTAPLPWFFYYYFPLFLTGLVLLAVYFGVKRNQKLGARV